MSETNTANPEMAELWNGPGARSWITAQALLDQAFRGFETLLATMAVDAGARAVLDVGCGTGATTRAIASRIAPEGTAVGLDLSAPHDRACRKAGGNGKLSCPLSRGRCADTCLHA